MNLGITIPKNNSFYLTDVVITNTGSSVVTVTITDGSGGTVKEVYIIPATSTQKIGYVVPKIFGNAVYVYASVASVINVSMNGLIGLIGQEMSLNGFT